MNKTFEDLLNITVEKPKKAIELTHCLQVTSGEWYGQNNYTLDSSKDYILLAKDACKGRDLIVGLSKASGKKVFYLGYWNDGVS